jgi:tetratricopeptide (TPR) repeat protein
MSNLRGFKQKLATVSRLWEEKDYDTAFAEVESLLKVWPGNAHLHILWARLVQLQEDPKHNLDEARRALQQAAELDKDFPAGAIELGYFLDNVEDNPQAASKAFAEGIPPARQLLIEGLIGQARALLQLDKREEFLRCLSEVLHLARFEAGSKRSKAEDSGADIFESLIGHFHAIQLKGPYAERIQELLGEAVAHRWPSLAERERGSP